MIRRRPAAVAVAVAAALAGGFGATHTASAQSVDRGDIRSDDERYWACLAVDHVEVGTCVENPLPDLSGYPSVPEVVGGLIDGLPVGQR